MSRLIMGISGALALSLMSGAAELARGRDLSSIAGNSIITTQALALSLRSPSEGATPVNRGSKADRVTGPAGSAAATRTISLKLDGFADTTFLVRIPAAIATSPAAKPAIRRQTVACEPVVSVLTEVAKRLQPGRCIT